MQNPNDPLRERTVLGYKLVQVFLDDDNAAVVNKLNEGWMFVGPPFDCEEYMVQPMILYEE